MKNFFVGFVGFVFSILISVGLAVVALKNGESINAAWIVLASLMTFFIGYRFYSYFLANRILQLDSSAITPALKYNDGLDYVPTNRWVLFGHHFAAIAGAGPLVGPVLAAQMGFAPGIIWILIGGIIGGAVQDFFILVISMRQDGRSLGSLITNDLGKKTGFIAKIATFLIMVIILAVLALIVVKALTHSPWSLFTVAATIPIGIFMGLYGYFFRPKRVGEVSVIGLLLLILAIYGGRLVAENPGWAPLFDLSAEKLVWWISGYGFVASILPVWLLLAPRDYLSTFLKIGTMLALALAIIFISPVLKMPAFTQFIDGSGPVWAGKLFPFLFITIACGAISGFHSLIASGTTPKMVANEKDTRLIGYGGMLMESFVALMAICTASCLEPGLYFALNSPPAFIGSTIEQASATINQWGFSLTPEMLINTAQTIGEQTILSRTGGAPTLAIGIATIFSQLFNQATLAFWYHFAILFEALFILTAVDAGTRAGRFMLQDLFSEFFPRMGNTQSWLANIIATSVCVGLWGYFLHQGVVDPFGGINTLWPLFGIANQMLAAMALILASVYLVRKNKERYLPVTLLPTIWLLICTETAAFLKLFATDPRLGFLAHAKQYKEAIQQGSLIAPAKTLTEMRAVIMNDYIDALFTFAFAGIVLFLAIWGGVRMYQMIKGNCPRESLGNHLDKSLVKNARCC
ncbi:Carbon starvation protein A (plasmid) [Legionella adelaidensis]|uniref:Carbon starvation protein A n=1 Tax=Legionella adelaidensis TaxID=45056 RepID=A0A0W0R1L6_9GAMM|nr:carbon starvation CstA family protein [Legionella adelaidensis]KTC64922.1 Carbon starvation protein A [Legionella adelaidensis]VEH85605.1 Carbon starvation protein A [Legionella adelaidensis]